jgi:hypothetical protein
VELKKDLSEGGRLSELQLNATENQIEKTSSMLRKYTESSLWNTLLRLESMGKTLRSTYTDAINEYPFILCKSPKAAVSFSPRILSVFKIEIMSA